MRSVFVTINNRWAYLSTRNNSSQALEEVRQFFRFRPKGYMWSPAFKLWQRSHAEAIRYGKSTTNLPGWDGWINFLTNGGKMPAGLFRAMHHECAKETGVEFNVTQTNLPDVKIVPGIPPPSDPTYAFQVGCVDKLVAAIPQGGGIVLAATGSGKTAVIARLFSRVKIPCLFLVNKINLLDQATRDLQAHLHEEIGHVGAGDRNIKRITVATVQTLARHMGNEQFRTWFQGVQILVVDELHMQMSKKNFKLVNTINPVARFGLTATLQLGEKDVQYNAHAFAGPVLYRFPIKEAADRGVVSKGGCLQLLFPPRQLDTAYRHHTERYAGEVIENLDKRKAVGRMTIHAIKRERHVLQLVDLRKHYRTMCSRAEYNNIRFSGASGDNREERQEVIEKFEKGVTDLLVATRVFTAGVSINAVDTIFDLGERPSVDNVLQKFGRGVRLNGKDKFLLYVDIGTRGKGKLSMAAQQRARALRGESIPVVTYKVNDADEALTIFKAALASVRAGNALEAIA
jgi:superfamily II DNA or RNA helicase